MVMDISNETRHISARPRLFNRAVIRVNADDADENVRDFLQGLVTQDCKGALPAWSGLLSPQGKALFDFILWADDDSDSDALLIDCEAEQAEALVRRLSLYRLRRKVGISVDPSLGVYWQRGSDQGIADPRRAEIGYRWIAEIANDDYDVSAAYLAHRLSLGVTEGLAELGSEQTLWLEANAEELNGVSFTKGCYIGQENTARMNWRQKVNRRMMVVPIEQADMKRQRIAYPELGLSVEHRRVSDET
jgi:folate-binding protein YgfZ